MSPNAMAMRSVIGRQLSPAFVNCRAPMLTLSPMSECVEKTYFGRASDSNLIEYTFQQKKNIFKNTIVVTQKFEI